MQLVSQWSNEIAKQVTRKVVKFYRALSGFVDGSKFFDKPKGKFYQVLLFEVGQAHFWALTGQTLAKPSKILLTSQAL